MRGGSLAPDLHKARAAAKAYLSQRGCSVRNGCWVGLSGCVDLVYRDGTDLCLGVVRAVSALSAGGLIPDGPVSIDELFGYDDLVREYDEAHPGSSARLDVLLVAWDALGPLVKVLVGISGRE